MGGDTHLASVECYGPGMGRWEQLPDLPWRAEGCGCACLPGRRLACVSGRGVSAAAVFSFRAGSWAKLPSMSVARSCAGVGYARGYLVVAGGTGEKMEVFASVEALPFSAADAAAADDSAGDGAQSTPKVKRR